MITRLAQAVIDWHERLDARLVAKATPEQLEAAKTWKGTWAYLLRSGVLVIALFVILIAALLAR